MKVAEKYGIKNPSTWRRPYLIPISFHFFSLKVHSSTLALKAKQNLSTSSADRKSVASKLLQALPLYDSSAYTKLNGSGSEETEITCQPCCLADNADNQQNVPTCSFLIFKGK